MVACGRAFAPLYKTFLPHGEEKSYRGSHYHEGQGVQNRTSSFLKSLIHFKRKMELTR
jgi:hypothetical protein